MSDYETLDLDEEEETEWREYRFAVGGVSEQAKQAIESVNGVVVPGTYRDVVYSSVRLLYHPDDDDQGFCWFTDDGQEARKLFISSADAHHDLYIYCEDGSIPCIQDEDPHFSESDTQLRLVTAGEWFAIADAKNL